MCYITMTYEDLQDNFIRKDHIEEILKQSDIYTRDEIITQLELILLNS